MIRSLLTSSLTTCALMLSANAFALTQTESAMVTASVIHSAVEAATQYAVQPLMLGQFNVGDSTDYKLSGGGGFLNGTAHMFVREQTATGGIWLEQDLDLGMLGKQKVEALYEGSKCTKLIVNGKEETPPDTSKQKVIESKKDHITVPKGEFDCIYLKIHDGDKNTDTEAWINRDVPVSGMVKTVAQSQIGPVTLELTNFSKK